MAPRPIKQAIFRVQKWVELDQAIIQTDVIMILRVQHERHHAKTSMSDYNQHYGLNPSRLARLPERSIILHRVR